MRILVADDSSINRDVALAQLETLGYTVDVVQDGNEVLEAIEFLRYDMILMDCHMPKLDGFETARKIRQREHSRKASGEAEFYGESQTPIYIIAMTASTVKADWEKCRAAGMNGFLNKPVTKELLRSAIEEGREKIGGAIAVDSSLRRARNDLQSDLPVDVGRLIELSGPKPEQLGKFIDRYEREAKEMVEKLSLAIAAASAPGVKQWSHKLRGTSATCGITAVLPALNELERLGGLGELKKAPMVFSELTEQLMRTRRFLSEHLESLSKAA